MQRARVSLVSPVKALAYGCPRTIAPSSPRAQRSAVDPPHFCALAWLCCACSGCHASRECEPARFDAWIFHVYEYSCGTGTYTCATAPQQNQALVQHCCQYVAAAAANVRCSLYDAGPPLLIVAVGGFIRLCRYVNS